MTAKQDTSNLTEDSVLTENSQLTSWWQHFLERSAHKRQPKVHSGSSILNTDFSPIPPQKEW